MRLRTRLAVVFLILLVISIFGTGILALDYSVDTMIGDLGLSTNLLVGQIFEQMKLVVASGSGDPLAQLQASAALRDLLDSSQAFGPSIVSAALITPDGKVAVAAHHDGEGMEAPTLKPIAALENVSSRPLPLAAIDELWNAEIYEARRPVFANGKLLATISVAVTTAMMADRVHRLMLIVLLIATAGTIVAWILLSLATNRIFKQLSQIARDFGKLAGAEDGVEVKVEGVEELAALTQRFSELSRRVNDARSQLVSGGDHLFDVVRSIQDGVLLLDPSNSILFANQQARDQLGLASDRMEGHSLKALLGDDHGLVALMGSAMDTGVEAHDVPVELDRGRALLVSLYKLGHGRTPAGLLAIIRDMRRVLELQTALDYSNRLARMGALISGVAHQLRSPLQGMNLRLELLRDAGSEHKERHIDRMRQEIERLDKAVEALLRFMRPEQLEVADFDLNQLVRETAGPLNSDSIRVEHNLDNALPMIRADRGMIAEALSNVVTNAIQAMPAGGLLTLSSRLNGSGAELTITDTGVGIEEERLDHIFDLYYTTKPQGTGLGLALALRAIELNKGTIKIDSRVGEGTTCIISLPTAEVLGTEAAFATSA